MPRVIVISYSEEIPPRKFREPAIFSELNYNGLWSDSHPSSETENNEVASNETKEKPLIPEKTRPRY